MSGYQEKVACVCVGNKDRSPLMRAIYGTLMPVVAFESFGIGAHILTDSFKGASENSRILARKTHIDLSKHVRRHISEVDLDSFAAFIAVNRTVAEALIANGVSSEKIFVMCEPNGLEDPHDKPIEDFERCAQSIADEYSKVLRFLQERCD